MERNKGEIEERGRDRQTDRQTDRQSEIERQTDRLTKRERGKRIWILFNF